MSRRSPYEFEGPAPDQPVWWTSLDDYAAQSTAPEARAEATAAEMPEGNWDFSDPVSRRTFMTLMGASISLATLQGCRRPVDHIMPYVRTPEDVTVNVTSFYATVINRRGEGVGLLVESHEGRPTKVEGNPDHSASRGKTDILSQASVLDLYDPDRSRKPVKGDAEKTYADFESELRAALQAHGSNGGTGLRVLTPPSISPTFVRLREAVKRRFPNARFHTWESATTSNARAGARLAFGEALAAVYDLTAAKTVLSLDCDFLQTETGVVRNTRAWAASRAVRTPDDEPSRLYVVEPVYSNTGGNADHRLRLAARDVEAYLRALAGRLVSTHNVDLGEVGAAVPWASEVVTRTRELEIIGGADIVEGFDSRDADIEPGTLMVTRPCQLSGSWKSKVDGRLVQPRFGQGVAPVNLPCRSAVSATALIERPVAGVPLGRRTLTVSLQQGLALAVAVAVGFAVAVAVGLAVAVAAGGMYSLRSVSLKEEPCHWRVWRRQPVELVQDSVVPGKCSSITKPLRSGRAVRSGSA